LGERVVKVDVRDAVVFQTQPRRQRGVGGKEVRRIWRPEASIRLRMTLWYVALLAVILLVFSGLLYLTLSQGLREEPNSGMRASRMARTSGRKG